jgi:hypothetical protein
MKPIFENIFVWPKVVLSIFRLNAQARVSWNSDFSYIYPILDTQGTLRNGGKIIFYSWFVLGNPNQLYMIILFFNYYTYFTTRDLILASQDCKK